MNLLLHHINKGQNNYLLDCPIEDKFILSVPLKMLTLVLFPG